MSIEEITIRKLRSNLDESDFQIAYSNLLLDNTNNLTPRDLQFLLKLGLIFLTYGDYSLAKLGYRIVLRYSNLYKDYTPLYDVAINKDYIPIAKFIEVSYFNSETISKRFFNSFLSSYKDNFLADGKYLTGGQKDLIGFSNKEQSNFVLVAPTSYGKSEIIINKVLSNPDKKLCIMVPSKALLAQTKRRLLENPKIVQLVKRVITHPEMYKGTEANFVAVLTQERLLRLLQKNPTLSLDLVLIDEAHNLLRGDTRAILLTQVLLILLKRNPSTVLNFFTPFVAEGNSLKIPYAEYEVKSRNTLEYLKVERFYYCDLKTDRKLFLYDQFISKSILVNEQVHSSDIEFIINYRSPKNIVYLNKPRDIETAAKALSAIYTVESSAELQNALNAISDFLHPDYTLLKCLSAGVCYHHGGMPDVIRLYVENLFSRIEKLEFIVTNSTLLEGVNIPAEKIFLLSNKVGRGNLSKAQFKNLIGRVCRFSEIFSNEKGNLNMLEPEIYLLKGDYADERSNLLSYLKQCAKSDITIEDEVKNIMLANDREGLSTEDKENLDKSLQYLENIEPNTIEVSNITYVTSEVGSLCFKNNVYDFDILLNEYQLNQNLVLHSGIVNINSTEGLMEFIYKIFIENIILTDENFQRLQNIQARKFYAMILEWRTTGSSYKQMIAKFTSYWNSLPDKIIYAGPKWGEIRRNDDSHRTLYVDLNDKTPVDKVNLAIVRIKEEQDYVDNNLIKYVEILNDLGKLNLDFYERIKYGTSDKYLICLLKNGFSLDLARTIRKPEYNLMVQINLEADEVRLDAEIILMMEANNENAILIFEASYHIS